MAFDLTNNELPTDLTVNNMSWGQGYFSNGIPVNPGETYTYGVQARFNIFPSPTVRLTCQTFNGSTWSFVPNVASNWLCEDGRENEWTQTVGIAEIPSGAQQFRVGLYWLNSFDTRPTSPQYRQFYAAQGNKVTALQSPKTAYNGSLVQITTDGIWTVNGQQTTIAAMFADHSLPGGPGSARRARIQEYVNKGWNTNMWVASVGAADDTILGGMSYFLMEMGPFLGEGAWGYQNWGLMESIIDGLKAKYPNQFIGYYFDDEYPHSPFGPMKTGLERIRARDGSARPIYVLNGNPGMTLRWNGLCDVVGTYAGGGNTGGAGSGSFSADTLNHMANQPKPFALYQVNFGPNTSMSTRVGDGLVSIGGGLAFWRDGAAPERNVVGRSWWPGCAADIASLAATVAARAGASGGGNHTVASTDSVALTESSSNVIDTFAYRTTDPMALTESSTVVHDTFHYSATDTLSLSESSTSSVDTFDRAATEMLSLSESSSAVHEALGRGGLDTVTLMDASSATGGGSFTRNDLASVLMVGLPFSRVLPDPNGGSEVNSADQLQLSNLFRGISLTNKAGSFSDHIVLIDEATEGFGLEISVDTINLSESGHAVLARGQVAHIVVPAPIGPSLQNITIPEFGVVGSFMLIMTYADQLDVVRQEAYMSIGVSDLTTSICLAWHSRNGVETSYTSHEFDDTANFVAYRGGVAGLTDLDTAVYNGLVTDGIQINWTTKSTQQLQVMAVFFHDTVDAHLLAQVASATHDITTPSFEPDLALALGGRQAFSTNILGQNVSVGAVANDEADSQAALALMDLNARPAAQVSAHLATDAVALEITDVGGVTDRIAVNNFDASGYTLQAVTGSLATAVMGLKFPSDSQGFLKVIQSPTSPQITSHTGLNNRVPEWLMIISSALPAADSNTAGGEVGMFGISSVIATSGYTAAISGDDARANMKTQSVLSSKAITVLRDDVTDTLIEADLDGFDADEFRINWTKVPATPRYFIAFGWSAARDVPASATDTVALTESSIPMISEAGAVVDTLTLTESGDVTNQNILCMMTDTVALTESAVGAATVPVDSTDSVALTDSSVTVHAYVLTATDTVALTDPRYAAALFQVGGQDTAALLDSALSATLYNLSESDSIALTESGSGISIDQGISSDSLSLTDSSSVTVGYGTSSVDTVALTDGMSPVMGYLVAASQSVALTDASASEFIQGANDSDTIALTDTADAVQDVAPVASQSIALTESSVVLRGKVGSLSDTVALTESSIGATAPELSATDTISLNESSTVQSAYTRVGLDTIAQTDSASSVTAYNVSSSDTVGLSDQTTSDSLGFPSAAATQSIILTESSAAMTQSHAAIATDSVALTESSGRQHQRTVDRVDSVALSESSTAPMNQPEATQDSLSLSDSSSAHVTRVAGLVDVIPLTESSALEGQMTGGDTDNISLSDHSEVRVDYVGTLTEPIGLIESRASVTTYQVSLSATIAIIEDGEFPSTLGFVDADVAVVPVVSVRIKVVPAVEMELATGPAVTARIDWNEPDE